MALGQSHVNIPPRALPGISVVVDETRANVVILAVSSYAVSKEVPVFLFSQSGGLLQQSSHADHG